MKWIKYKKLFVLTFLLMGFTFNCKKDPADNSWMLLLGLSGNGSSENVSQPGFAVNITPEFSIKKYTRSRLTKVNLFDLEKKLNDLMENDSY